MNAATTTPATNYRLFMNYDKVINVIGTLDYFINVYGQKAVNDFINCPTSIHWSVTFTAID